MESGNGNIFIEPNMTYPVLLLPKKCTALESSHKNAENVYIDVSITTLDSEQNNTTIYKGFCNVKLVDSYKLIDNQVRTPESSFSESQIDQMPVILSELNAFPTYSQSQVWIDPLRSPYVYNHYDTSDGEQYFNCEAGGLTNVQQHNTYITQNVYNCNESNISRHRDPQHSPLKDLECKRYRKVQETMMMAQMDGNLNCYEPDEFECGVFLSQLPEEIMNEEQTRVKEKRTALKENNALKQLMSSDIQSTSKQRKTIMFLGNNMQSRHTIQNISYNNPLMTCSEINADMECDLARDSAAGNLKKKYQCDQCKQIFDQISTFRMHMVGTQSVHTSGEPTFKCQECGKSFKKIQKFENHCLGHGDPDLECSKCGKVLASKFSLRMHHKIHNRKYKCIRCSMSYEKFDDFKYHCKKTHFMFLCDDDQCAFVSSTEIELLEHKQSHHTEEIIETFKVEDQEVEVLDESLLCSRQDLSSSNFDFSLLNHNLSEPGHDLAMSSNDQGEPRLDPSESIHGLVKSSDDLAGSSNDLAGTRHGLVGSCYDLNVSSNDLAGSSNDLTGASHDIAGSSDDLVRSSRDFAGSSYGKPGRKKKSAQSTNDTGARTRDADSVIAQVVGNSMFLLDPTEAKRRRYLKTCAVCQKSFSRIDDLKRHLIEHIIRSTLAQISVNRSGEYNITCKVCHVEQFTRIDKYKIHLREHAKLTIYKCAICDKSFSDSSNFSKHKKIHGVPCLQCDLCLRKFSSKKMIEQHMMQHNSTVPVECDYCDKMFYFKSMLNKHIRAMHSKEVMKFRCRFCKLICSSFREKWDHEWKVHHLRKEIMDCHICGAQYRKYSDLKRHCFDDHVECTTRAKRLLMKTRSKTKAMVSYR